MPALVTERMYFTSYSYRVCQSWLHLYLAMMWSWHIMAVVLKCGHWAYFPFAWQDPCPGAYGRKALVFIMFYALSSSTQVCIHAFSENICVVVFCKMQLSEMFQCWRTSLVKKCDFKRVQNGNTENQANKDNSRHSPAFFSVISFKGIFICTFM